MTRSGNRCAIWGAALAAAAILAACGGEGDGDGDGDGNEPDAGQLSPSCQEATEHSDLLWIQDNVFTPSCAAFSACHMGNAVSARGLNLESGNSETNLVGVTSVINSEFELVVPGDPANSFLMNILGSYDNATLGVQGTMPPNNPLLCQQKRDAIERWILSL